MKRWPLVASFILFIALCASAAYWAMQAFAPPVRPAAAPPPSADIAPISAAAGLFGGRSNAAVASNFQLKGVVVSGNPSDSVAILSADGKPAQAVRANSEIMPGVTVKEVHRQYVLLSDGGIIKRVELPEEAKSSGGMTSSSTKPPVSARPAPAGAAPPRVIVSPPAQTQQPAQAAPSVAGVPQPPRPPAPPQPPTSVQPPASAQPPANAGAPAMPANQAGSPSNDLGGPSIGYNPAGAQTAPPPAPATPSMQNAAPAQPTAQAQSAPPAAPPATQQPR